MFFKDTSAVKTSVLHAFRFGYPVITRLRLSVHGYNCPLQNISVLFLTIRFIFSSEQKNEYVKVPDIFYTAGYAEIPDPLA